MTQWRDHIKGGIAWRERTGDGPVLVCLHGIGSRAFGWEGLAIHLPGWRLIAWDAPGYGQSDVLPMAWPVARDYAGALNCLTIALGLGRFHLLGHSLGTLIGASYARFYPQGLESLTLASCAQGGGVAPGSALPSKYQTRINDLQDLGAEQFSVTRAPRLIEQSEANPDLVALVRRGMASVTLPGYTQAVRMLASGNLVADCAGLSTPTAVVVGAQDQITPPAQSEAAYAALAAPAGFDLIPYCGHAVPLQAPKALAERLLAQAVCAKQGLSS